MTVENLPTRGIHWVKYLSDRLSQQNDSNILPTCRATFQLILFGSYRGSDLFDEGKILHNCVPELRFLKTSEIVYGLSENRKVTYQEKLLYFKTFARIVKLGCLLEDLLVTPIGGKYLLSAKMKRTKKRLSI